MNPPEAVVLSLLAEAGIFFFCAYSIRVTMKGFFGDGIDIWLFAAESEG